MLKVVAIILSINCVLVGHMRNCIVNSKPGEGLLILPFVMTQSLDVPASSLIIIDSVESI